MITRPRGKSENAIQNPNFMLKKAVYSLRNALISYKIVISRLSLLGRRDFWTCYSKPRRRNKKDRNKKEEKKKSKNQVYHLRRAFQRDHSRIVQFGEELPERDGCCAIL